MLNAMNPEHKTTAWLQARLAAAIQSFNNSPDLRLLEAEVTDEGHNHGAVGERAITHRLAVHLEQEFRNHGYPNEEAMLAVDCEYNRHRGAVKAHLAKDKIRERVEAAKGMVLKEHPKKKGWYVFTVLPDIIVHQRGHDDCNLLVTELKRASNTIDDELDNLKLELFVKQDYEDGYGYLLGASIIAYDSDEFGARRLELGKLFVDPNLAQ
jgi:hypothetical protein